MPIIYDLIIVDDGRFVCTHKNALYINKIVYAQLKKETLLESYVKRTRESSCEL